MTESPTVIGTPPAASPLGTFVADPAILVSGGRFYLFPTTDGLDGWASTSFSCYSSSDLVDWVDEGVVLELGTDVFWSDRHAWAPAVLEQNGVFYLYFTADDHIGVATSDRPNGPFVDLGRPLVPRGVFPGRAIDPSVFVDDDDSTWLVWGNSVANAVRLNADLISFPHDAVLSWVPTGFCEAAKIHRFNDIYYLTWSENDTRSEDYRVRWASGLSVVGPWTDGGVLLEKVVDRGILATGHHDVVRIPGTDEWIIAYHRFALEGGDGFHREIVFDRLHHARDGSLTPVVPSSSPLRIYPPTTQH